jgi:subtilase family serine protease
VVATALGAGTGPASARSGQVRIGSAPKLSSGAKLLAGEAAVKPMQISLALVPEHAAELARYAREVSEPGSSRYRQYLTAAQFARRFGASPATVTRVERSLRAHGLRSLGLSSNRLSLKIKASTAAVEHAFNLQLASFRLTDGRDVTLNMEAPAVDRRIAGSVQAVVGLSGLATMRAPLEHAAAASGGTTSPSGTAHSSKHVVTGGPQPCGAATTAATEQDSYTPDQIASAYDFSGLYQQGDLGAGITIAVYELEPDLSTDIAAFQKCMGTDTSITYAPVDSGVGTGEGSGEAALDIEQLIAFAPDAKLLVYQGPNSNSDSPGSGPYDTFAQIIGQDKAQVISNSWGECEAVEGKTDATAESTLFEEAALQGQTVVSASGDDGAQDCDSGGNNPNTSLAVDDPASQPFVTGVGGTALESLGDPPTIGLTETAWNDHDEPGISTLGIEPGAGGGGLSTIWPMPAYQRNAAATLDVVQGNSVQNGCSAAAGYCRQVPDVSINADPAMGYISYFNGTGNDHQALAGWQGTGGTSSASPVWAALFALSDALPACGGESIGFANPSLYALAGSSESTYFNDVSSGGNDFTGTASGLFPAGVGYDMATGLGSPKAAALAAGLCGQVVHVSGPTSERMFVGTSVQANQQYTGTPPAGVDEALSFSGSGLPAGVSVDQTTGLLSGEPTKAGVYRSHIAATTPTGTIGSMLVTWTVEGRPTVVNTSLTTVTGQPQLALTVASGEAEPGLRSVTLTLPSGVRLAPDLSGIQIRSSNGAKLHFSRTIKDGALTLVLKTASTRFRVLLGPGTLVAQANVRAEARRVTPPPLRLSVAAVDSSDASSTISASVRPRA